MMLSRMCISNSITRSDHHPQDSFSLRLTAKYLPSHVSIRTSRQQRPAVQHQVLRAAVQAARTSIKPTKLEPDAVQAVLFDMDGVLCNSEKLSSRVAVEVFKNLYGIDVLPREFLEFAGTGEANFLGSVAKKYSLPFDVTTAKAAFFELYLERCASPSTNIAYEGAVELILACRKAGLKTAVASSADLIKVNCNLKAAGIDQLWFDAVVSADLFQRLKPAPDIFLAAAEQLDVLPRNCIVIEDASAGIQAARAAGMRCIGVTTSISESTMTANSPDCVRSYIGQISLDDILNLKAAAETPSEDAWLSEELELPGGYTPQRRDVLKLGSLGMGLAALYAVLTKSRVGLEDEHLLPTVMSTLELAASM